MLPLVIGSNLELSSHNCQQEERQLKTQLFFKSASLLVCNAPSLQFDYCVSARVRDCVRAYVRACVRACARLCLF